MLHISKDKPRRYGEQKNIQNTSQVFPAAEPMRYFFISHNIYPILLAEIWVIARSDNSCCKSLNEEAAAGDALSGVSSAPATRRPAAHYKRSRKVKTCFIAAFCRPGAAQTGGLPKARGHHLRRVANLLMNSVVAGSRPSFSIIKKKLLVF